MLTLLPLRRWTVLAAFITLPWTPSALAITPDDARQAQADAEKASTAGPADIPLASQAKLHLPKGMAFVPQPQAGQWLVAMGNPGKDTRLQGIVMPQGDENWIMTVRYEASGYVRDDDAKDWNADDLLKSYREGTDAANEEREKMGVPGLEILGWAEKPAYDASTHRLAWAMSSRTKGAAADASQGVNYNTYALGREGYFSLNLITDLEELPTYRGQAQKLLSALDYDEGKRYADFNDKTDHVAEYGLAALVVGVAVKKLGLLALGAAFVAKFAKIILLGFALVGGSAAKWFGRKSAPVPTATTLATAEVPVAPTPAAATTVPEAAAAPVATTPSAAPGEGVVAIAPHELTQTKRDSAS